MFNPNEVTRPDVPGNPRQQGATSAKAASYDVLRKRMPSLVPAMYGYDDAFVFSRLTTLFHSVQRSPFAGFIKHP